MNYWQTRMAKAQDKLTAKRVKDIDKQVAQYYAKSMEKVINSFEITYLKVLQQVEEGKPITPAHLYKLDSYWKMQGELRKELEKLGYKQIALLSKQFENEFYDIYNSIALPSQTAFSTVSHEAVAQMINQVWVADGLSWSQRIWNNTEQLAQTLNDELIHCVATGKKTSELKNILQERFNVSYGRADALVRTELAHIQTQAAQQRYKDYGIQEVEVFVDEDERTCPECAKHEGERYPINAQMPVPFHPRCRCCMVPVVE
jgi:SPP1 gp7 family putative phage head morphogenesis protein